MFMQLLQCLKVTDVVMPLIDAASLALAWAFYL